MEKRRSFIGEARRAAAVIVVTASATLAACAENPVAPGVDAVPQLAKGGGKPGGEMPTTYPASWTITDRDVASDGGGTYVDGVCGVSASLNLRDDGQWGSQMAPGSTPGCPRSATLTLALRHVSDMPHVDDASSPLGTFDILNFGFVLDSGLGKINPLGNGDVTPCFTRARNGRLSGAGLRFDPAAFPGSNSLVSAGSIDSGFVLETRSWPDNVAYCDTNGVVEFWHVTMSLHIDRVTP